MIFDLLLHGFLKEQVDFDPAFRCVQAAHEMLKEPSRAVPERRSGEYVPRKINISQTQPGNTG